MTSTQALLGLTSAQIRRHPGRAFTLGATVALAVTLLTAAFVLSASLRSAIDDGLKVRWAHTDIVVRTQLGAADTQLNAPTSTSAFSPAALRSFGRLPGVAAVSSSTRATAVARTGGTAIGISIESQSADPSFRWQGWSAGHAPDATPTIGLTGYTLQRLGIQVGDLVSIGTSTLGAANFRVTGEIDERGSLEYADQAYGIVSEATARTLAGIDGPNVVLLRTTAHTDPAAVVNAVNNAGLGGWAQTTSDLIHGADAAEQTRLAGINAILFSFSPIALVVSAIVLGTATLVSLGSRRRHVALLRSVGATRTQTFLLLLMEVTALGALGTGAGLLLGTALARAGLPLVGLIPGVPSVPGSAFRIPTGGLILAAAAGLVLSLVAALVPAAAASRIPPAAVLAATPTAPVRRVRGATLGLLMVATGAIVLGATDAHHWVLACTGMALTVLGAVVSFGYAVALAAGWLSRRLQDRRHVITELAANGLSREPGRAAAEGIAILLAATLISATWALLASLHTSGSQRLDALPTPDLTIGSSAGTTPLTADALARFRSVAGVRTIVDLPQGVGVVVRGTGTDHRPVILSTGVIGQTLSALQEGAPVSIASVAADTIYLPNDFYRPFADGTTVSLVGPKGHLDRLRVAYVDDLDLPALVSPAVLSRVTTRTEVRTAWVRLAPGVDRARVLGDLSGVAVIAGQVPVNGPALLDLRFSRGIAVTTAASTAFLGVALLVAVIGAVLVTALSVSERTGENAVLRALGLERPSLRQLLLRRALGVASAAAVAGVLLGTTIGLVGATLLTRHLGIGTVHRVPWLPILILSLAVVLIVRAAALVPLARAARISPAYALNQAGE
ncbi:MAG: FtsX-like permease family protein [Bacillota bacterium]